MKSFLFNMGYFAKEMMRIIRLNLLSNIFSVMSTGMILFLLGIVITGTDIGNRLVVMLNEESEVNGYFSQDTTEEERNALVNRIGRLDGVRSSRLVAEDEAKARMEDILGDEAKILELFDKNPFEAFVEIRIEVNAMDSIIDEVRKTDGIEYVRDNREVLEKIQDITYALKIIGYLMIVAVGVTTLIILSHMIRQGIYNNKDQINTLRLLGSPGAFIGFPYILTGVILTLIGGIIAALFMVILINKAYDGVASTILFISLPARGDIINKIIYGLPSLSLVLGFFGSLFGLSSIKEKS
ncbi:MAG: permease-like cell division protein FtsX [Bacillota bacterium]|nr:permease-like cell division protein FtsX [Bacillota bacterium]